MNLKTVICTAAVLTSSYTTAFPTPFKRDIDLEKRIVETYSEVAHSSYLDSLAGVEMLDEAIQNFVKSPTQTNFDSAKELWVREARMPYGQTEIFRFVNGPIDFEAIGGESDFLSGIGFEGVEGLVNAWPLDEAYIDYVDGDANAGVINNPAFRITRENLVIMNERDGEKNISTGFHAIEFLLWGQDTDLYGPGDRSVNDFVTAKNADRRMLYLETLSEVLVDHIDTVTEQWAPDQTNYRNSLKNLDPREVIKMMFVSMTSMAGDELKSERIENALLLEDQEEEHSCFSDTTVNDIYTNYLGVKNIYLGQYEAINSNALDVKGAGVSDLVALTNPALDQAILEAMNSVEEAIAPFYGVSVQNMVLGTNEITVPFDLAITSQQSSVQEIIDSLDALDGLLKQAAQELGFTL